MDASYQDYCVIGAGIGMAGASIALHERIGFAHSGTVRHAGFKFSLYQPTLQMPTEPCWMESPSPTEIFKLDEFNT